MSKGIKGASITVIVLCQSLLAMVCTHVLFGQSIPGMSRCKAKHGYMQDRDAQHARGMQEASGRVVHDLEVKVKQLQSQLEQSQQALHTVKAQYGQQETLVQTQQHMDKLQCDLASERQKVTKLSSKSQEVAKAKQDVLLATKALQVRQLQPANPISTPHARHTTRIDQMKQQRDTYHLPRLWLAARTCLDICCNASAGQGKAGWQTAAEAAAPAECN